MLHLQIITDPFWPGLTSRSVITCNNLSWQIRLDLSIPAMSSVTLLTCPDLQLSVMTQPICDDLFIPGITRHDLPWPGITSPDLSCTSLLLMTYRNLSWLHLTCHNLSWLVMTFHKMYYLVMTCHNLSYLVMNCHNLSCPNWYVSSQSSFWQYFLHPAYCGLAQNTIIATFLRIWRICGQGGSFSLESVGTGRVGRILIIHHLENRMASQVGFYYNSAFVRILEMWMNIHITKHPQKMQLTLNLTSHKTSKRNP